MRICGQQQGGGIDFQEERAFLEAHGNPYIVFPYDFTERYAAERIAVQREGSGFPFVMHRGRKLYGKKNWSDMQLARYYNGLLCEQDEESPHRYLFPERMPQKDCVLADVGAAEGIFTLDLISSIKKAYLFECDREWIAALRLTFAEELRRGTIEIVEAFVGAEDNAEKKTLTLDTFFKDKPLDYVKADIEGAEEAMLAGGERVFAQKVRNVLLCCYHRQDAERAFRAYLGEKGFAHIAVNARWMIWIWQQEPLQAPYLRRGVLFASKA